MNVIDVAGLEKSFGPRVIMCGATFAIGEEEKVGLVGANGSGKSSLFRILAGLEEIDAGSITMKRGAGIGYLPQEPLLEEGRTVGDVVEQGLGEIRAAVAEFTRLSEQMAQGGGDMERLLARQGELSNWIGHHGGWNVDHRVEEIMTHLGIPDRHQKVGELSGGTRRRVALARLLLEAPDLLLLDEPTNHLDADTTEWLQEYLRDYPGAVLLITHDRYFLDQVVGRMLELENGGMTSFAGGYSGYLEQKQEQLENSARAHSRLLNLLRVETAWMRRGAKARTTKQKARIDRFHALQEKTTVQQRRETALRFQAGDTLGGTVLELHGVAKARGDKLLCQGLTYLMKRGERVGVIGPNGCGKTTLIRMIMGEVEPDSGRVVVGKKTKIAYFDQNRAMLDPEQTMYDFLGEGDYVKTGNERRHKIGYLEDFLFPASDRMRQIKTLSGGEKSRLILARLMLEDANMLILDEPTNDLDIPTLQLLDEALSNFAGAVLIVTHDRFFLDKVATSILSFEGQGKVVHYEGNYSIYRTLRDQAQAVRVEEKPAKAPVVETAAQAASAAPRKKGLTYAERLELEKLEQTIAELEEVKAAVEVKLSDPTAYSGEDGGIGAIAVEHARLEGELASHYSRWEELEIKRGDA